MTKRELALRAHQSNLPSRTGRMSSSFRVGDRVRVRCQQHPSVGTVWSSLGGLADFTVVHDNGDICRWVWSDLEIIGPLEELGACTVSPTAEGAS